MPTQHTTNEEEDVDDDYVYEQMMMMTGSRVFNLCLFKHLPRCIDNVSRKKEVCTEICNFSIEEVLSSIITEIHIY